ncbi:hypothetical protein [Prochlorococcus marinus]|uniref:Uncharacterized protein n=1 Tax=Prochlorococcus marinus (strain AS9601) TaxID=146891 RepID=A2BSD1_PROMS|nr:hypothetical protein [Prochlorococcus marinus]ABM70692.1 Hypothetical protein A9601_14081 [Prochlorococcus marinus str. AS9601]
MFFKKKYDILLICNDEDKAEIKDGKYFSKFLDSLKILLETYNLKSLSLALPFARRYGGSTYSNAISVNLEIFFIKVIRKVLQKINLYNGIEIFLNKCSLTEDKFYQNFIKKFGIRLVICIGANKYICQACRESKINIVELLHGLGYSKIPWGWSYEEIKNLPTHIWSLDRASTKVFKPLEGMGIILEEIEHPWYSQFENFKEGSFGSISFLSKKNSPIKNKKVVLLSLTCGYDGDEGTYLYRKNVIKNGLIPSNLMELLEDQNQNIFWFIRRHPKQEAKMKYNNQKKLLDQICKKNKNVDWRQATSVSLPYLLPYVDCHITMNSQICYDTAIYGIKSLGLCPSLIKGNSYQFAFQDLEEANLFKRGVSKKDDILSFILESKKIKPFKLTCRNRDDFVKTIYRAIK